MVKRVLSFLNKGSNTVNEAALLLGCFTLFSQLLGLVRDRLLAYQVHAGATLDIYYAAFRIPDFLYISVASLASVTVLLPFLVKKINKDTNDNKDANVFIHGVFTVYMIFMVIISILVCILMPYLAHYIAPGFSVEQTNLLIHTSRIMLISPIFIGLSNLIGTVTQMYKNFFVFSLSPVFYNVGILFGIVFLYPIYGVYGLSYGVILGAFLHLCIQLPVFFSHGFNFRFISRVNYKEIYEIVYTSLPRTVTLSANTLAFIVLIAFASTLKEGSISLFTFSFNLQSVPVGIIGVSYSVAAFPTLVRIFSDKNIEDFRIYILNVAKQIIFWSLPVISLFIVLRAQIVRVVLGSHSFSWSDTRLTAASTALFILSLLSQSLVLLFVRGYYASGNTRKPLFINVFSSCMIIVFAYFFIYLFRIYPNILSFIEGILRLKGVNGTSMLALPFAYALGSILNMSLILVLFKRDFLRGVNTNIMKTFIQSLFGALVLGVVSYYMLDVFDDLFNLSTGVGVFLQGLLSGFIGIVFCVYTLYLLKSKELFDIIQALSNKLNTKNIIAPEQKDL